MHGNIASPSNSYTRLEMTMRILLSAIGVVGLLVFVLSFFSPRISLNAALVGLLAFVVTLLLSVVMRKRDVN
jgi:hypothetical protein